MSTRAKPHLRDADLLRVEDLVVEFRASKGRTVHAVSGISFDLARGETLSLVGESGCGKSSTGRALIQLPPPKSGSVSFRGRELLGIAPSEMRALRRNIQMIFQDPVASLNPRRRVGDIVAEPLQVWGASDGFKQRANDSPTEPSRTFPRANGTWTSGSVQDHQWHLVSQILEAVGLDPDSARYKYPHEFSGGQCQRISIARALVLGPELIVCDEPVSALDVSVQAQILNLLEDLKVQYGLTLFFISHDLAVVKNISDRVAVMYLGKLCEISDSEELYAKPAHPYTAELLRSVPVPDPGVAVDGAVATAAELPSPLEPPSGCRFRTRCEHVTRICTESEPPMRAVSDDHFVACHHPLVATQDPKEGRIHVQPAPQTAAAFAAS